MAVNCLAGCNFMYSYLLEWNTLFLVGVIVWVYFICLKESCNIPKQTFNKRK